MGNIVCVGDETTRNPGTETLMNAPTPSAAADKPLPADSEVEAEISKLVEQNIARRPSQIEIDAERIRSSVARLTSSSVDGLEGLTSELQQLQKFLKSEVERVQSEIESALAGIKIIVETIAPWKDMVSLASPTGTRPVRSGPAANIEGTSSRR
jgi:exonuclease VII large subunit